MQYDIQQINDFARALYGAERKLQIVPYGLTTAFAALAQNATLTNVINVNANADFIMLAIRHRSQIGGAQTFATGTVPFIRILITDTGTGEQYTNSAVDLQNYSVNGQFTRQLPYPRWISGRTALSLQATNYAPTAETYTTTDVYLDGVLVRVLG